MNALLRFVAPDRHRLSGRREGLFHAAAKLAAQGHMAAHELAEYHDLRQWFVDNLARPTRFSTSKRPNAQARALSWFKPAGTAHIARMRDLQRLVEGCGVPVTVLRTDRPGYVCYEDDWQIVAYPFADTPT